MNSCLAFSPSNYVWLGECVARRTGGYLPLCRFFGRLFLILGLFQYGLRQFGHNVGLATLGIHLYPHLLHSRILNLSRLVTHKPPYRLARYYHTMITDQCKHFIGIDMYIAYRLKQFRVWNESPSVSSWGVSPKSPVAFYFHVPLLH